MQDNDSTKQWQVTHSQDLTEEQAFSQAVAAD